MPIGAHGAPRCGQPEPATACHPDAALGTRWQRPSARRRRCPSWEHVVRAQPGRKASASVKRDDSAAALPAEGRVRGPAVVDRLLPQVDGGRFAAEMHGGRAGKHHGALFHRWPRTSSASCCAGRNWDAPTTASTSKCRGSRTMSMSAEFTPPAPGRYRFTAIAWVDHSASPGDTPSWSAVPTLPTSRSTLLVGAELIEQAAGSPGVGQRRSDPA